MITVCKNSSLYSIKDSPIQLDHDSVSEGAFSEWGGEGGQALGREGPRSVMAGGTVKGWLPDVAVVLWRRMLGSLGRRQKIKPYQLVSKTAFGGFVLFSNLFFHHCVTVMFVPEKFHTLFIFSR
jgi:hypothetical protein